MLKRIYSSGNSLTTSITVIGETITQLMEHGPDCEPINVFRELLEDFKISIKFPNDTVRILCYHIGEELTDRDGLFREFTDRTHMAYAIAYDSDFFITTDISLKSFILPKSLKDEGFIKPITISLPNFFKTYIR